MTGKNFKITMCEYEEKLSYICYLPELSIVYYVYSISFLEMIDFSSCYVLIY
jgi:hypothetical protein